ncbi:YybH family protein [Croceimicrobium sp.]|uniref:YybH family protein n=1 Tax=Croceimicrobium sp. TaxID=2828340 RepID=UPI003BA9580F
MKKLLLFCLIGGLFVACQSPKPETATEVKKLDKKALREYIVAMEDTLAMAYRQKDIDLFSKFYADNAVTYGEGRDQLFGKRDILNHFRHSVAADSTHSFNFKYSTIDVFATADDMAVESGRWAELDSSGAEIEHGFYMVVFQKEDGRLVSVRDMWNSAKSD